MNKSRHQIKDKLLETESGNFKVRLKASIFEAPPLSPPIPLTSTFDLYKMSTFVLYGTVFPLFVDT